MDFRYGDYTEGYNYSISSPNFDEEKIITNGRLTLGNIDDTMQYGIYKISHDTIRLIYLPRGNFSHVLQIAYISMKWNLNDHIFQTQKQQVSILL